MRRKKRTGWLAAGGAEAHRDAVAVEREGGVIQLAGREEKSHDFIASIRFGSYCSLGKAIPDHTLQ